MSSKGLTFLAFIAGAGIGSVCTWQKQLMPKEKA